MEATWSDAAGMSPHDMPARTDRQTWQLMYITYVPNAAKTSADHYWHSPMILHTWRSMTTD